jgi:cobalt-precorrin 5A hydrolase
MKELNSIAFEDISIEMFCKCSRLKEECADFYVEEDLSSWTKKQFEKKNAILFIGATGIAVRAIADSVENKLTDSPVLVMDDRGEYIISLLSGHVGGANELAMTIGGRTGSVPVITTATDINGKFAADVFAKKNSLSIINKGGIAMVSSKVLAGEKVSICIGEEIPVDEEAKDAFAKKHEEDLILLSEKDAGETCDIFIGKKN